MSHDVRWLEAEDLEYGSQDGLVCNRSGAEGIDMDAYGFRMTDRVGELHLCLRCESRRDDVFGYPSAHVGGTTVNLGRVLSGEGSPTMPPHASISVDDDLAACEARVTLRAANHKLTGRIDQELGLLRQHALGKHRLDDLFNAEFFDFGVLGSFSVLCGDDNIGDAGWLPIHIFHGNL